MVLTAVLLDLDGTLFDHATAALQGQRAWFDALGRRSTPALEAAWTVAEQRHFRSWREGEISFDEQRRRRLREVLPLLGLPVGDDSELDLLFTQGYLRAYRDAWCAFDDVEPALRAIHAAGLRTAVLTNGTREQQNAKIDALGLTGRLGPVVTSEELGVASLDPRPSCGCATGWGCARTTPCTSATTMPSTCWPPARPACVRFTWTAPGPARRTRSRA